MGIKTLVLVAIMLGCLTVAAAKPKMQPRIVKTCWEVTCDGPVGMCIVLHENANGSSGVKGIANIKKVPCPSTRILPNPAHGTAAFVFTEYNTGVGLGWIKSDAGVDAGTRQAVITEYDDTRTFTSYAEWQAALQGAGPIE